MSVHQSALVCPHCSTAITVEVAPVQAGVHPGGNGWNPETVADYRAALCERSVKALRGWFEQTGESPSQRQWKKARPSGAPSLSAICNVYGSWNKALAAARLPYRHPCGAGHGPNVGRNRQMVTGRTWSDQDSGTVKHFDGPVTA